MKPEDLTAAAAHSREAMQAIAHIAREGGTGGMTYIMRSAEDVPGLLDHIAGLQRVIDDQEARLLAQAERLGKPDAYIWVHPGRLGGKPCIGGTRIPVATVTRYVRGGGGIQAAQTAHPELTRTQVLLACWHAAVCGDAPEWAAWAEEQGGALWAGLFDEIPEPPTGEPPLEEYLATKLAAAGNEIIALREGGKPC
jgi:uncharacterized protein (DUF433 family)